MADGRYQHILKRYIGLTWRQFPDDCVIWFIKEQHYLLLKLCVLFIRFGVRKVAFLIVYVIEAINSCSFFLSFMELIISSLWCHNRKLFCPKGCCKATTLETPSMQRHINMSSQKEIGTAGIEIESSFLTNPNPEFRSFCVKHWINSLQRFEKDSNRIELKVQSYLSLYLIRSRCSDLDISHQMWFVL